jgi:hypothetical protein
MAALLMARRGTLWLRGCWLWEMTVEMGDRLWRSFFKVEGHRLAFVGRELGFSRGAAAVWCVRGRKWELSFLFSGKKGGPTGV